MAEKKSPKKNSLFPMRLNKYLAHSGVCSRRKAAELIKDGLVFYNGKVERNPAILVSRTDKVKYKGKVVKPSRSYIYLLLNKPKNTITTMSDEKGRKTVWDIVESKVQERIYPVGRLDRNTTGLLLLTNDGSLTKRLSHPRYKVQKIYHASLDKPLKAEDMKKIEKGLNLEDGPVKVDSIEYVKGAPKTDVGITIHLGKNRIVRRIFESLGYEVLKLDRVYFGGLTKKDLPRGWSRFLTKQEVIMLKHFS